MYPYFNQHLAQTLHAHRRQQGMSSAAMAKALGICESAVHNMEAGRIKITVERLLDYCQALPDPLHPGAIIQQARVTP